MSSAASSWCRIEPLESRRLFTYSLAQLTFDSYGGANLENDLNNSPDINTAGSILGGQTTTSIFTHAVLRVVRSGVVKFIDVGDFSETLNSYGRGMNDNNEFVGDWTDSKGTNHPFLSKLGKSDKVTLTKLADVKGMAGAIAYAVNDTGLAVGSVGSITAKEQATAWVPGKGGKYTATPLPRLGKVTAVPGFVAQSIAVDVNDTGTIVGTAVDSTLRQRAAIWTKGKSSYTVADLGAIAGGTGFSFAYAINSAGVVAGSSTAKDLSMHAVLFKPNTKGKYSVVDLGGPGGFLGAVATDVNTAGVVVGETNEGAAQSHAALWTLSKGKYVLTDLNNKLPKNSGWVLEQATSINDAGVILGSGLFNGGVATFMLTPSGKGTSIQVTSPPPAPAAPAAEPAELKLTNDVSSFSRDKDIVDLLLPTS